MSPITSRMGYLIGSYLFLGLRASSCWVFTNLYIIVLDNVLLTADVSVICWLGTTLNILVLGKKLLYIEKTKTLSGLYWLVIVSTSDEWFFTTKNFCNEYELFFATLNIGTLQRVTSVFWQRTTSATCNERILQRVTIEFLQRATSATSKEQLLQRITSEFCNE